MNKFNIKQYAINSLLLAVLLGFAVFGSLAKADGNDLAVEICGKGYNSWPSIEPVEKFEKAVLMHLDLPEDTPNKEKIISKFFNENNSKLICGEDTDNYIRQHEHLFKRSLARAEHTYLIHIANHVDYELDWNFYEMVDGKKETILDYLDMIINDPDLAEDYNVPELKTLIGTIEEIGGKRGREL